MPNRSATPGRYQTWLVNERSRERGRHTHWFNGEFGHSQLTSLVEADFSIWHAARRSAPDQMRTSRINPNRSINRAHGAAHQYPNRPNKLNDLSNGEGRCKEDWGTNSLPSLTLCSNSGSFICALVMATLKLVIVVTGEYEIIHTNRRPNINCSQSVTAPFDHHTQTCHSLVLSYL